MPVTFIQHLLNIPNTEIDLPYFVLGPSREELIEASHENPRDWRSVHLLLEWLQRFVGFGLVEHMF